MSFGCRVLVASIIFGSSIIDPRSWIHEQSAWSNLVHVEQNSEPHKIFGRVTFPCCSSHNNIETDSCNCDGCCSCGLTSDVGDDQCNYPFQCCSPPLESVDSCQGRRACLDENANFIASFSCNGVEGKNARPALRQHQA